MFWLGDSYLWSASFREKIWDKFNINGYQKKIPDEMTLNVNKNNISATLQLIVTENYAKWDQYISLGLFVIQLSKVTAAW